MAVKKKCETFFQHSVSNFGKGKSGGSVADEALIAVFVDYENLALGVRDIKLESLQLDLILKRLLEKGRIVYKRAYCDWSQYRNEVRDLHGLGIENVQFLEHVIADALTGF